MINLVRENTFNNDVVIVDGHCNSGKALISRILEYYERVEKSLENEIFYYTTRLYGLNKMSKDSAIALLKTSADRDLHNLLIGRDINFRISDATSFFKYPFPMVYIKRALSPEYDKHYVSNNKPIYQTMMHNSLKYIDILSETFGDNLREIYVTRNPVDLVHDIYKRGFGDRIGTDPKEIKFCFKKKNEVVPTFAEEWSTEYLNMDPLERVVKMTHYQTKRDSEGYRNLSKERKKQVMFIDFDKFTQDPKPICKDLESFLGTKMNKKINRRLKKERCPRILDYNKREENKSFIINNVSETYSRMMMRLIEDYEKEIR